MTTLEQSKS